MTGNGRIRGSVIAAVIIVLLAGSWFLGRATRPSGAPSQAGATSSLSAAEGSTGSPDPSPSVTDSPTPSPTTAAPSLTTTAPRSAVEAGITSDFGYGRSTKTVAGYVHLSFDRATLLTGKAANDYAAAHGMATPVPNDYLVVNDNPKLRDLVLAPTVTIYGDVLLAGNSSGAPVPVSLATFESRLRTVHDIPLDITYDKNLLVVKISEHFFP